jgi:hypothetical protein
LSGDLGGGIIGPIEQHHTAARRRPMTNYLISFPSAAMIVAEEDFPDVVESSHAVVREMQAAGVLVFAGGLAGDVEPVRVSEDGSAIPGTYPQTREFDGGFTVIDVPTREEATV